MLLKENFLTLKTLQETIFGNKHIRISDDRVHKIELTYKSLENASHNDKPIYGLNTGFGALAESKISRLDNNVLQKNILLSHACGVGDPFDYFTAKTLLFLRINTLLQGYSGASLNLVNYLVALFNGGFAPYVPKKGSVGASGDLAPLAHLGLLVLGIGKALDKDGNMILAKDALKFLHLNPLVLGLRDGIALINGTQAMGASAVISLIKISNLITKANDALLMTASALGAHKEAFDYKVAMLKNHKGVREVAKFLYENLSGNDCKNISNKRTQDPYSIRCAPVVHGASLDFFSMAKKTILDEINGVSDNPLFFAMELPELQYLSGGNFHGQYLALALDSLAMAIAELGNISERRMELLLNENQSLGLPPFLTKDAGLNSGYMMLQVTASALVNENKILCTPASIDSIPSSAGREDHVSMGMTCANKLTVIIENVQAIIAIETMMAIKALSFRNLNSFNRYVEEKYEHYGFFIKDHEYDNFFMDDLAKLSNMIFKI